MKLPGCNADKTNPGGESRISLLHLHISMTQTDLFFYLISEIGIYSYTGVLTGHVLTVTRHFRAATYIVLIPNNFFLGSRKGKEIKNEVDSNE